MHDLFNYNFFTSTSSIVNNKTSLMKWCMCKFYEKKVKYPITVMWICSFKFENLITVETNISEFNKPSKVEDLW